MYKVFGILVFIIILIGCNSTEIVDSPPKIPRNQIQFQEDKATINLDEYAWFYYNVTDERSMYPAITGSSLGIGLPVDNNTDISVGDMISFKVADSKYRYTHRVIAIGRDDKGIFYRTKGDNNKKPDEIKVRKWDISYIVAAVIY
jgi:signal peptidase I